MMNNVLSEQHTNAVLAILVEQLGVNLDQLTPEARIEADLGADSLDMIEIVMAVEERFQICVADEEVSEVSTVGDLLQTLARVMATSEAQVP